MLVEQVVATQLGVMVKAFDPKACRDGWFTFAGYADDGAMTLEPVTFRVIERAAPNPELAPDVAVED